MTRPTMGDDVLEGMGKGLKYGAGIGGTIGGIGGAASASRGLLSALEQHRINPKSTLGMFILKHGLRGLIGGAAGGVVGATSGALNGVPLGGAYGAFKHQGE